MAKSLLEVLRDVSLDENEQAAFSADPSGYLAQYGYEDVHPDDISEAFGLVADTLPPELAQTVAESQAAGPFGGGTIGADEGLAGNGVPAPDFGAGYEPVTSDPGGADLVDDGGLGLDDFDGDTAFGEGVSESVGGDGLDDLDSVTEDSGLADLADDSGLADTGFGQGGDSGESGVGAGYAETGGYDDGQYDGDIGTGTGTDDGGYGTETGGYGSETETGTDADDGYSGDAGGYGDSGYDSGADTGGDYDADASPDVDDIGSF